MTTKNKPNIATLPPTSAAAEQHSLRTYHQVQQWLDFHSNATERGWKMTKERLDPIPTMKDAAPEELLRDISCKCASGCGKACGCRKTGLQCSVLCYFCNGTSCTNAAVDKIKLLENEEESDEEFDDEGEHEENVVDDNYNIINERCSSASKRLKK